MRRSLLSATLFAASLAFTMPAQAADGAAQAAKPSAAEIAPTVGDSLRDGSGRRLGSIYRVADDAVMIILDMKMYRIPRDTLSMSAKGLQTTMKRSDIR